MSKCVFENSNLKITRVIYPKKSPEPNILLLVSHTRSHKLHLLTGGNCKSESGQLQNNRQLQNNTVKDAMSITINRVISD